MLVESPSLADALGQIVGAEHVRHGAAVRPWLSDDREGLRSDGHADAVVFPASASQVADVVALCHDWRLPIVPRGGGSGFAGGCVPRGGVVVCTERLRSHEIHPEAWRGRFGAGLTTRDVQRLARENGLWYPPDPGASEQSHIGGNVATNAGGPHAFKYGVTGAWVTGLEVVLAPGEVVSVGGPIRKDVAGYDLISLLCGSEGTLGIITSVWLRLIPPVEAACPVVAQFGDLESACEAVLAAMASGCVPAAVEFLDAGTLMVAGSGFPATLSSAAPFVVIAEADGTVDESRAGRAMLIEAFASANHVYAPLATNEVDELWRWREGVALGVAGARGAKISEDITVPVERLNEALTKINAIASRHDLAACTWGHAGDGNLHATFMVDPADEPAMRRARRAGHELLELAIALGGSITGEHGIGEAKNGHLRNQWSPRTVSLHNAVKSIFDPEDLLNPGKKMP